MKLNAGTKVDSLLKQYPFLLDFLITLSPHFKNLKNPLIRKIMGKVATLKQAADIGGLDVGGLVEKLTAEIDRSTAQTDAGDTISEDEQRQAILKDIIRDLHDGKDPEVLKQKFRELISGVEATEIARMEQTLISEGMPVEQIKQLCDVHVEIFKEALEEKDRPQPPLGHPVHTFMKENRASEKIMSDTSILIGLFGHPPTVEAFQAHGQELGRLIDHLSQIDIHYTRKENQLFPMLEAHHFTGPSQVMWSIHDDIRAALKKARQAFAKSDPQGTLSPLQEAIQAIRDMIYKEEHILCPASLDMLSDSEWVKMKNGESDIGYAWVTPDEGWPDETIKAPEAAPAEPVEAAKDLAGRLDLNTGQMTLEQINLVLTHLPVDLTFVDENDRVAYYSEGPERIFPRSPAITGREVRNCHPPNSVHVVNKILDAFKSGARDTAAFWIELSGKFIFIRYFAVRDATGRYRGCLEVSQDLTAIRKLEGQQRLLDWE